MKPNLKGPLTTFLLTAVLMLGICQPVEGQLFQRWRAKRQAATCSGPDCQLKTAPTCSGPGCTASEAPACSGPGCQNLQLFPQDKLNLMPQVDVQPETRQELAQEIQPVPLGLSDDQVLEMEDWGRTAARFLVGNSCGSGSICGHYNGGTLFLTNAHVTGTRPGTQCKIRMVVDGETREFQGRVIMAAYSDKTLTDWSVVHVEEKIPVEPRKLSIDKPSGSHTTVGSPRCVWPLARQNLRTVEISDGSPLWRWTPNSIGGQSGSGVWSLDDGLQYGLLTWSWGGYGAGQQTAEIYRQARQQTVSGAPRPEGLKELVLPPEVIVENGFFAQAGITDLPIWDDGTGGEEPFSGLTQTLMNAVPAGADKCEIAAAINTADYLDANKALLTTGVYTDLSKWPGLANAWFGYVMASNDSLAELIEGLDHFKVELCPPVPEEPQLDEDDQRLLAKVREIFQKIREIRRARAARGERAINWIQIIELILRLIEAFGGQMVATCPAASYGTYTVPSCTVELALAA